MAKWVRENPERHKANQAKRNREKRQEINAYNREQYASNPEPRIARNAQWNAANSEKRRQIARDYANKARERLSDSYVALTMNMRVSEVPKSLLETKRVVLKIKRYIQEQK